METLRGGAFVPDPAANLDDDDVWRGCEGPDSLLSSDCSEPCAVFGRRDNRIDEFDLVLPFGPSGDLGEAFGLSIVSSPIRFMSTFPKVVLSGAKGLVNVGFSPMLFVGIALSTGWTRLGK